MFESEVTGNGPRSCCVSRKLVVGETETVFPKGIKAHWTYSDVYWKGLDAHKENGAKWRLFPVDRRSTGPKPMGRATLLGN
jgi:hypothetical protein